MRNLISTLLILSLFACTKTAQEVEPENSTVLISNFVFLDLQFAEGQNAFNESLAEHFSTADIKVSHVVNGELIAYSNPSNTAIEYTNPIDTRGWDSFLDANERTVLMVKALANGSIETISSGDVADTGFSEIHLQLNETNTISIKAYWTKTHNPLNFYISGVEYKGSLLSKDTDLNTELGAWKITLE